LKILLHVKCQVINGKCNSVTREEQEPLKQPQMNIEYLQASYGEWLQALGYSKSTVYYNPRQIGEYLHYLKSQNIKNLEEVKEEHTKAYITELKTRKHKRRNGILSASYLNKNIGIIRSFGKFVRQVYGKTIPTEIKNYETIESQTIVLTKQEVKSLYRATKEDGLGMRDRAMLGVYYGCGLRRSEGEQLNLTDIQLEEKLLIVRKGKNNKERIVPFTEGIQNDFRVYINHGRKELLNSPWSNGSNQESFFVSRKGKRVHASSLYQRFKKLANLAGIIKQVGLHTLRHSIATHLLQQGMELESIQYFLGHSTLESTQIYTHIAND